MHARSLLAATAAAGLGATLLTFAPAAGAHPAGSAGRAAVCKEASLHVAASASEAPGVLRISVTNRGPACVVDRIPTVTFGDLDGAAQPFPATENAPYRIGEGRTAYAAVRTVDDPGSPQARVVDHVTVAGDPSHRGSRITADALGLPDGVRVWEPVTTWWKPTRAEADAALPS
ncbi:DUF4232 domain-containing protein [Streptomyces sp. NPDC059002]|uniref:DUF4232 domain-containing protein n=1 Tax=Streptomyces sp. NPDC059002 TaxID=3346690 RepID=UPI003682A669